MSDTKDFPKPLYNRSGLPSIIYRIGDYTSFRQYLLSLLSQERNDSRPLAKLTTRASDDSAIALLDAWAVVGDVLTFYQERIANEGYLRTATERLSVLELARAIGYELNPGVAASTSLAFLVDDSLGSPGVATVPKGTIIKSIPGEGEKSQTFETDSTIIARADWNTLQPRPSKPQEITSTSQQIYLQGTNTQLQAGDRILLLDEVWQNTDQYLLTVTDVTSIPEAGATRVIWEEPLISPITAPLRNPKVFAFRKQAALFGNNAPRWDSLPNEIKRTNGGIMRGGVFRRDDQGSSWIASSGDLADTKSLLPTIDIRCLAVNQRGYLFAGTTGSGIFRSLDHGQTWTIVNTGLTNQNIQSLSVDELGCLFAGAASGGVFQSKDEGENWNPIGIGSVRVEPKDNNQVEAVNTGLPNTVIRSLLAYTPEALTQLSGTINSTNADVNNTIGNVTKFITELRPGDIIAVAGQTRIVTSITSDNGLTVNTRFRNNLPTGTTYFKGGTYIFAGTDDGIYLSVDQGKNWELKGLLNRSVRSLLILHTISVATGTIASNGTTVTGAGTKFTTELRAGDAIAASNQVRIIQTITNDSVLTIDKAFDSDITTPVAFSIIPASKTDIFAGTDDGIFRSRDYGNNWTQFTQRGLPNHNITALVADTLPGKGTIQSSGIIITGTNTNFTTDLQVGDTINAAGQTKIVISITSDTALTIDTSFSSDLTQGIHFEIVSKTSIFAGTAGDGVFISTDNGNRWDAINQDLANQDITSLTTYLESNTNTTNLIAGTTGGIFVAINLNNPSWTQINQGLTASHVTSLAAYISRNGTISSQDATVTGIATSFTKELKKGDTITASGQIRTVKEITSDTLLVVDVAFSPELPSGTSFISQNLFAGTLFAGFVENEWPNFQIPDRQIDLDTLYPTILADSWIVLVNSNHFQASLVESTANISRRNFLLDTKLTRVLLTNSVNNPDDFGLRETLVLSQSENLALAEERLTVAVQQNKIFQEPIRNNEIYLSQFITGLQAQQTLLVSGKQIRAQINVGGFLRSLNWEPRNQGLGKLEAKALLIDGNGELFAGTKNGAFRSADGGQNWEQISGELQGQEVTSLLAYTRDGGKLTVVGVHATVRPLLGILEELQNGRTITIKLTNDLWETRKIISIDKTRNNRPVLTLDTPFSQTPKTGTPFTITTLFAGMKKGIWQSIDDGQTWKNIDNNITNIQALAINRVSGLLLAGTVNRGVYRYNNNQWFQVGLNEENIQSLVIQINLNNSYIFAGTANNGIFRSTNNGNSWQHFTDIKQGTGTISSNHTTINGIATLFNRELREGDIINAGNQSRTVKQINSDTSLIIDPAFSDNLPTGTIFTINTGLTNRNITTLLVDGNYLFAGTDGSGVFRSTDNGEHWQQINTNLLDTNIRSLAVNSRAGLLFVGTAKRGVFRSLDQGNFWLPINAGLIDQPVWTMVILEESEELFVGTANGVFHSTNNGSNWQEIHWERSNQGLSLPQIQALTFAQTNESLYLFAGNQEGVFRSIDNGDYWEPVNEGLTNQAVQVLTVKIDRNLLFAGTSDGMFRSSDWGENWQTTNTGLTHRNVQAVASLEDKLFAATRNGGIFVSTNQGDRWTFSGLLDINVKALAINSDNQYIFAGTTSNGIFRSIDAGERWEQLLTEKLGTGEISSKGTTVTGVGTFFTSELKVGGTITATEQVRIITGINDSTLTVNTPFRPDLPLGTKFTVNTGLTSKNITALLAYAQLLKGTISGNGINVVGVGTEFSKELRVGEAIAVHKQTKIVTNIVSDTEFTVDTSWDNLPTGSTFSKTYLFAGTAGSGIFRSQNNGTTWEFVGSEQTALLEVRCLEVNPENQDIVAGTARGGVFHSANHGDTWEALPVGLTSTDVKAIAIHQSNIMVGGVGILLSADSFDVAQVKPDDQLWVIAPPVPFPSAGENSQRWQLLDKNGFIGIAATTNPQDITLQPAAKEDPSFSEVTAIQTPPIDQKLPILKLTQPLQGSYDPATVRIYGNVVRATHGETVANEVLGSGDGTTDNQRFVLKKPPLTYTSANTTTGNESTLQVYVNDVRWQELPSLDQLDDKAQSYIIRIEDDNTTTVIFGDGKNGARLPSGQENVTATYRSGIGLAGNVSAESLSLLKTRPLGIQEVTNPLPAAGGAAKETLDTARAKAPATVRTLDRIVSLRDFEDFTATFAGIGKAKAVALWNGDSQIVHITVAGSNGEIIATTSSLYENLLKAIDGARDPLQRVQVDAYEQLLFNLEATIQFDQRYKIDKLEVEIRKTLSEKFAFGHRAFGQGVNASEAIAFIQNIKGVIAVDLDALYRQQFSKTLAESIPALLARLNVTTNQIRPAQLLLLNPKGMTLKLEGIS